MILGLWATGSATVALGWPWNNDMADQPAIRPQERPRLSPEGSVPVGGRERPWDRCAADGVLTSPFPITQASVREGENLFQDHCALCHGVKGKGNGQLASKFIPSPDLTTKFYKKTTDGYIYGVIRSGGHLMPSYGDALGVKERWHIVNYIRSLQGIGPVSKRVFAGLPAPAPCPQPQLPPGRGRALVLGYCAGCHDISLVTVSRDDRAGWSDIIRVMVEEEGAPRPSDEHRRVLLDYFTTHFGR